jgi:hypothetical protein
MVLGKPDVEFGEPFSDITAIRELRDGRVIVLDSRELSIKLVDFKRGTSEQIGRNGAGPGEYQWPQRVFALPVDSSAILDGPSRSLLVVTPSGRMSGSFDPRGALAQDRVAAFLAPPSATDAQGRMYGRRSPCASPRTIRHFD